MRLTFYQLTSHQTALCRCSESTPWPVRELENQTRRVLGDNVDCKRTPGEPVTRAETPDQRCRFAGLKPLIPEDKMIPCPPPHLSRKLVHACALAKLNELELWRQGAGRVEKGVRERFGERLPLREHHRAFLTHNAFVTMIGAVVARALEQATRERATAALQLKSDKKVRADDPEVLELTLDLLADRYYVRNIVCHDSSKTSALEAPRRFASWRCTSKTQLQKKSAVERLIRSSDRLVEMHADLGR
ncbi:hypothetical protein Q5P01_000688 [Channa striata]|uniref:Uncharacterized protein n=1 Tax=Channa striata TaxID=64152 RepID=A0AA88LIX2_CHASR|nr:hypothetical protein Q5P01_000688 [Channa striata]